MAQLMSTVARAVGTMSIKQMHTAIQEVRTEGEGDKRGGRREERGVCPLQPLGGERRGERRRRQKKEYAPFSPFLVDSKSPLSFF